MQKTQSWWKPKAKLPHMMEKPPKAGIQGKIFCFCYFDVTVEKEEMGNPIKIKMHYTAFFKAISEQEFLTLYGLSWLERKTREYTDV